MDNESSQKGEIPWYRRLEPVLNTPRIPVQTGQLIHEVDENAPRIAGPGIEDIVEIRPEAREMAALSRATPDDFKPQRVPPSYTKDDVQDIKARFQNLMGNKRQVQSGIQSLLKKHNISFKGTDNLKLELDSKGRVLVGGVADAATAKKIESLINDDTALVKSIKDHRKEERAVSQALKDATGVSLNDYKLRYLDVQNGRLPNQPYNYEEERNCTKEDMMSFVDQDLYAVDKEFTDGIREYIEMDSLCEVSTARSILENPCETMKKTMLTAVDKITEFFEAKNEQIKEVVKATTPEQQEFLDSLLLSLKDATIEIGSDGTVNIEGKVAEDPMKNAEGIKGIQQIINGMMEPNPYTGEKCDYNIAAERLINLYEDEFDLPDSPAAVMTTIANGNVSTVESHISSPEREAELAEEIRENANEALHRMGMDPMVELEIVVDEEGKVSAANLDEVAGSDSIQTLLDQLNDSLAIVKGDDSPGASSAARLRQNLDEHAVYQKGGAREVQKEYGPEKTA